MGSGATSRWGSMTSLSLWSLADVSTLAQSPARKTWDRFQPQASVHMTKFFMLWFPVHKMGLEQTRTSRAWGLNEATH